MTGPLGAFSFEKSDISPLDLFAEAAVIHQPIPM
jgi:hypothetical protein